MIELIKIYFHENLQTQNLNAMLIGFHKIIRLKLFCLFFVKQFSFDVNIDVFGKFI